MAMKLLKAREEGGGFFFRVHVNDAKLDEAGNPDLAFVYEATWGKTPAAGQTRAQYIAAIRRELKLLAEIELAKRQPPVSTALPGEGQPL